METITHGDRWVIHDRWEVSEYSVFVSTVWLHVPHMGGTYETLLALEDVSEEAQQFWEEHSGEDSWNREDAPVDFDDVVCRHQTRAQALLAHHKLNVAFRQIDPEPRLTEDVYSLAGTIIQSGVQYDVRSLCCDKPLSTDMEYLRETHTESLINRLQGYTALRGGVCTECRKPCEEADLYAVY